MLKNKSLFIILLFILGLLFFSSSVFASEGNYTNEQIRSFYNECVNYLNLNSLEYNNYIIFNESNFIRAVFFRPETKVARISWAAIEDYYLELDYAYFLGSNIDGTFNADSFITTDGTVFECFKASNIVYSSFDIPKEDDGTIFFQKTPLKGTLEPIMGEMDMKIIFKEIIQILPLIIVVVVCFLGLRKALQMLLTLLRRFLII